MITADSQFYVKASEPTRLIFIIKKYTFQNKKGLKKINTALQGLKR